MKKTKSPRETKSAAAVAVAPKPVILWWPWAAGLLGAILAFAVYNPALNGPFVFDDRYQEFNAPHVRERMIDWVVGLRPMLMFTFWANYRLVGGVIDSDWPYWLHVTNVVFHLMTSILVALIATRLLDWAGVSGRMRAFLAVFSGGLFLLHPLQTESVAYVTSRSEGLSVMFYYAAFAVFLWKNTESMTILRALAVTILFGAAAATKEHTLTLPVLLLFTDFFWNRGIKKNILLYGLLAIAGAVGGVFVYRVVFGGSTAGFNVQGLPPATYFFTQCRVIWTYVRLFVLPVGQNVDPDVALSRSPLDYGAILGMLALAGVIAAAWIFRKRYPLASFGIFVFLLLLAPTSSFIPIRDVLAERRAYLPFLGLILIVCELLRRIKVRQAVGVGVAVLAACAVLSYQRNQAWGSPLALWEDTVAKSPNKYRPRFQLAQAEFDNYNYAAAAQSYQKASELGPSDTPLLLDWALALDGADLPDQAIAKLNQALLHDRSALVYSQIGMIYAKRGRVQEALQALTEAEGIDPSIAITHFYRGNLYLQAGDRDAAKREYNRTLELDPQNAAAREALSRMGR